ncbi:ATP-dependent DNA ligase [Tranquillimonas alkanivorans]|uniref:ATP-dependent DNA ligase n=1 Tax=Tranquillimonas alkanivorans TaxID=441119 RepID=A0A1I5WQ14_9RHOB|nr:hypothetical protein [Tranquillimonas alkanivorans]SFQ21671.1 ATP-dependent DNA ligase [Tranquillimonas alkanivorans]
MSVPLDTKPMEAQAIGALPEGQGWLYEPKYDGFRCLAHVHGAQAHLRSKNRKALGRYFSEIVEALLEVPEGDFFLDGEIISPEGFEALQLRLHPAATRVQELSVRHPAKLVVFDIPERKTTSLLSQPLSERRRKLEELMTKLGRSRTLTLGKSTHSIKTARNWVGMQGLDGVMAKKLDLRYEPGKRAMKKYKVWKTVDCVIGGIYGKAGTRILDSLLLGLYDDHDLLHYVGWARIPPGGQEMGELLRELEAGADFTGRKPGKRDRWGGGDRDYVPLTPVVVAEMWTDHITDDFMRHGVRLLRFRQDKDPENCRIDQIK